MSQKTIASILLLIAGALGGPVAVDHAIEVQEHVVTSVKIEGPTEVEVGELVELNVTGARPSWLVPVEDAYIDDDLCILSFRKPGEYSITAASIAGRTTRVVKHVITVGKPVPPTPPAPPEPEPTPEGQLTNLVVQWCAEAKTDRDVAKTLGDNFINAASVSSSIDELLQNVASKNRMVDQRTAAKVLAKIQQHLYDNLAGEDFVTHQRAFDEIGQGFLQYAGTAGQSIFWE